MTAENARPADTDRALAVASMRPRPMTAENGGQPRHGQGRQAASMRPRPMTAENADYARAFYFDPGELQ